MPKATIKFTYEDYKNLPESETNRYELIEGELLMVPSPSFEHQDISVHLEVALYEFVHEHQLGKVLHAPLDVVLDDENVVQPDIIFISKARSHIGVAEYWLVDPEKKTIEVLKLGASGFERVALYTQVETLTSPLLPGLRISLREIFSLET
jgi:Uma2 family endonuclease